MTEFRIGGQNYKISKGRSGWTLEFLFKGVYHPLGTYPNEAAARRAAAADAQVLRQYRMKL